MAQALAQYSEGTVIQLKEGGSLVDFYVAKHDYESGLNGAGRTLLVRKNIYGYRQWNSDVVNAYANSYIDNWFNGDYKAILDASIRELIGSTKFYYTPEGLATMTTLSRGVFALSLAELGWTDYRYADTQGTPLPIADTLKIAQGTSGATTQWTRTCCTDMTAYNYNAFYITSDGSPCAPVDGDVDEGQGARPVFTLPGACVVQDDGTVVMPPDSPDHISVPSTSMTGQQVSATWGGWTV